MKNIIGILLAFSLVLISEPLSAQKKSDPEGFVTYSLPSTVITVEVEAVQERFFAGPYAKYAEKYLGMKVRQKDEEKYQISAISLTPYVEADQSRRYTMNVKKGQIDATFLKLSSCGLISFADASFGDASMWRFTVDGEGDFTGKGLSSHLTSESATLYRSQKKESSYDKVSVRQSMLVEKTPEKRAAEAAQMILDLRDHRLKIITGDTDATYSGEAMGAAVAELTRLEEEYMSLFTGYSEYQTQRRQFEVIPQPGDNQMYVAFRLSDSAGLVPPDNLVGRPIVMELVPQVFEQKKVTEEEVLNDKKPVLAYFRIPAICSLRILSGSDLLMQTRVPVYQLGQESSIPVNVILK